MREIKFRAWNKEKKVMFFNAQNIYDACDWYADEETNGTSTNKDEWLGLDSFGALLRREYMIPMQYTGLKDKNGKEIYEGDVVMVGEIQKYNATVRWMDSCNCHGWELHHIKPKSWKLKKELCLCWHTCNQSYHHECDSLNCKNIEIIGNIYETPELLEGR